MKSHASKREARVGILFATVFVFSAVGIGIFAVLHANQLEPVPPQSVPQVTSEQNTPFYALAIHAVKTGQTDQVNQTKQVTIDVAINNPSNQPMQIAPGLQMLLINNDGQAYPMTAKYLPVGAVIGGQLNAKASKTYAVDFEIPLATNPKALNFQLDASYRPVQLGVE